MKQICAKIVIGMLVSVAFCGLFTLAAADNEPNDSFQDAQMIDAGQFTGTLSGQDTKDAYSYNMPGGARWQLTCTVVSGDPALFTIFDFDQKPIAPSSKIDASANWTHTYRTGQIVSRYYLVAERDPLGPQHTSSYMFSLAFYNQTDANSPGDAGDDINSPKNMGGVLQFNGTVGDADRADFFTLACAPEDQVHLVLGVVSGNGSGFMKFYNPDLTQMAMSTKAAVGGEVRLDQEAPAAGTYYIEVFSSDDHKGAGCDYYMKVSNVPKPPKDVTPPGVRIRTPLDAATLNRTAVVITGNATDDRVIEKVELSINDGPMVTATGTDQWSIAVVLSVGQNNIFARALDASGNNGSHAITVNVTGTGQANDTVAPVITFTAPADGEAVLQNNQEVRGSASDNKAVLRVELKVNDRPWMVVPGIAHWAVPVLLENGPNTIWARAVDTSGNTATRMMTVFVILPPGTDPVAPNIRITAPQNHTVFKNLAFTVLGEADDNVAVMKVDVSINGGPWALVEAGNPQWAPWTYNATFVNGNNIVSARAMDTSGNIKTDSVTVYAAAGTSDVAPPALSITFPANGTVVNTTGIRVQGTSLDNIAVVSIEVSVNDGPWQVATGTGVWTCNVVLVPGANVIKARATDSSANTNTTQSTIVFNANADLVMPVLVISYPSANSTFASDNMEIRGISSDNVNVVRVELTLNGVKVPVTGTASWKARLAMKQPRNHIVVTAYDAAGNSVSQDLWVNYAKPAPKPPVPGFEMVFLVAALAASVALMRRRRWV